MSEQINGDPGISNEEFQVRLEKLNEELHVAFHALSGGPCAFNLTVRRQNAAIFAIGNTEMETQVNMLAITLQNIHAKLTGV